MRSKALHVFVASLVVVVMLAPATAQAWTQAVHGTVSDYAISYTGMKSTSSRPFAAQFKAGQAYVDAWDGPNAVSKSEYHFNTSFWNGGAFGSHNHTIPAPSDDTRFAKWYSHKSQAEYYATVARLFTVGSSTWTYYMKSAAYQLGMGNHALQDIDGHGQIGVFCHKGLLCTCNTMKNVDVDNPNVGFGGYTGAQRVSRSKGKAGQYLYSARYSIPELFN
jgi:hypothetical protein